jgi:hypothetical protein
MTISDLAGVERPAAVQHAQGSYLALFESDWPSDLRRAERFAVAARGRPAPGGGGGRALSRSPGDGQSSGVRWTALKRHAEPLALSQTGYRMTCKHWRMLTGHDGDRDAVAGDRVHEFQVRVLAAAPAGRFT